MSVPVLIHMVSLILKKILTNINEMSFPLSLCGSFYPLSPSLNPRPQSPHDQGIEKRSWPHYSFFLEPNYPIRSCLVLADTSPLAANPKPVLANKMNGTSGSNTRQYLQGILVLFSCQNIMVSMVPSHFW